MVVGYWRLVWKISFCIPDGDDWEIWHKQMFEKKLEQWDEKSNFHPSHFHPFQTAHHTSPDFPEFLVFAQTVQQKVSELKKTPQIYGWKLDNTLCNLIWKLSQPCADEYSTLARTKKFKRSSEGNLSSGAKKLSGQQQWQRVEKKIQ